VSISALAEVVVHALPIIMKEIIWQRNRGVYTMEGREIRMDSMDRALLNAIQNHFPITVHPYRILGTSVGTTEEDAFSRIEKLQKQGIIRRIGGVFDSRRLGYFSTLCTAKVPEEKIPMLAKLLEGIPGVTHNYIRNHDYNVWFTLIARSEDVAESALQMIREEIGVSEIYSLPATHLFKIEVSFDFEKSNETSIHPELQMKKPNDQVRYELNSEDIDLIRVLQGNLPNSLTP